MATVIQKTPFVGVTGQCLVLGTRERLIYPFNLGDYSEIRMGMFWSTTSGSADNTIVVNNDTVAQNSTYNQIYFGFSNFNTGAYVPGEVNGYDYIGTVGRYNTQPCGIYGDSSNVQFVGGANGGGGLTLFKMGITDLTGACSIASGFDNNGLDFDMKCPSVDQTGATQFAGFFGLRLFTSGSKAYGIQRFTNGGTYSSNVTTAALRTNVANLGTSRGTICTGFMTSGGVEAANRMMLPNAIYIYTPMMNTRLRIHNLVVERYA